VILIFRPFTLILRLELNTSFDIREGTPIRKLTESANFEGRLRACSKSIVPAAFRGQPNLPTSGHALLNLGKPQSRANERLETYIVDRAQVIGRNKSFYWSVYELETEGQCTI